MHSFRKIKTALLIGCLGLSHTWAEEPMETLTKGHLAPAMPYRVYMSLLSDADRKDKWAPGGYQLMSVHAPSNRMYVAMHPNGHEGSHKDPATEISASTRPANSVSSAPPATTPSP